MTVITRRGRGLAWKLNPYIGTTTAIEETCSLIARHAITYNRIQELWCNSERANNHTPTREYYEAREAWLEARITDLVADLPHTDDGPFRVEFQGDPRGSTVQIWLPNTHRGSSYALAAADDSYTY